MCLLAQFGVRECTETFAVFKAAPQYIPHDLVNEIPHVQFVAHCVVHPIIDLLLCAYAAHMLVCVGNFM